MEEKEWGREEKEGRKNEQQTEGNGVIVSARIVKERDSSG